MSKERNIAGPLAPHQQALLDNFIGGSLGAFHLARWDTGLGVTSTISQIIAEFIERAPSSRILVLCSRKAIAFQVHQQLDRVGTSSIFVDRFQYRVMRDSATSGSSLWNQGGVSVLAMDFAMQGDVRTSLLSVPWTLLIVLDAYELRGEREQLVQGLISASTEAQVLMFAVPGSEVPKLGIESWTDSTVRHFDVVDYSGRRIDALPVVQLVPIRSEPDAPLVHLWQVLAKSVQTGDANGVVRSTIESAMNSSIPALEETLSRLLDGLADEVTTIDNQVDGDGSPSTRIMWRVLDRSRMNEKLVECLAELDNVSQDTKLAGLVRRLVEARKNGTLPKSACILTTYRATLIYLQTALQEEGFVVRSVHGAMSLGARFESTKRFHDEGGVLLATTAVGSSLADISLAKVELLVLYDSPRSSSILREIIGRFQRFGRTSPLTVEVIDADHAFETLTRILSEDQDEQRKLASPDLLLEP